MLDKAYKLKHRQNTPKGVISHTIKNTQSGSILTEKNQMSIEKAQEYNKKFETTFVAISKQKTYLETKILKLKTQLKNLES